MAKRKWKVPVPTKTELMVPCVICGKVVLRVETRILLIGNACKKHPGVKEHGEKQ